MHFPVAQNILDHTYHGCHTLKYRVPTISRVATPSGTFPKPTYSEHGGKGDDKKCFLTVVKLRSDLRPLAKIRWCRINCDDDIETEAKSRCEIERQMENERNMSSMLILFAFEKKYDLWRLLLICDPENRAINSYLAFSTVECFSTLCWVSK